jgi:hypothetical protein
MEAVAAALRERPGRPNIIGSVANKARRAQAKAFAPIGGLSANRENVASKAMAEARSRDGLGPAKSR